MRGLQKSKRVSWPSDVNLCQVRLFLSEECPSQVGLGPQDHLQAKTSWLLHSNTMGTDDNLPPGFESLHSAIQLKNQSSQIPLVKWTCPPRLVLNLEWQVVAGEESQEVELQNQREMRVLEAIYPRPSAIPINPSVTMATEELHINNQQAPLIPITSIEDEDTATDTFFDPMQPINIPSTSQPVLDTSVIQNTSQNIPFNLNSASSAVPGPEAHVVASAALNIITQTNQQGSLIDQNLLIQILNNPKLIENLARDYGPSTNSQTIPNPSTGPGPGLFYPNGLQPPVAGPVHISATKDINYIKNLIQEHGGDRHEAQEQTSLLGANQGPLQSSKSRDSKPKINKPCIYYNSSRGCVHGANCSYQHDESFQQRPQKKVKVVDREIAGT